MPRKALAAPASKEAPVNEAAITDFSAAQNQLAVITQDHELNLVTLGQQLGYSGALTVGALEDGIRFYQQRSAEACLELGKRLILLKEATPHGEFQSRLELLGVEYQTAKKFMAAALKFSKGSTSTLLKVANTQSKLLELLILDDDQVLELEADGTVLGMTSDEVSRMGVRELRSKLREAKAEKVADDELLAAKNDKIDKLSRRIAKATPDEVLLELQKEATALMNDALGCIRGQLRGACIALKNHGDGDVDHSRFMAGLLGQVQADLSALRDEFNLPDVSNAADQQLVAEMAQWDK